jgi:putative Mg2+ transporter-C (MgtC) family protein
VIFKEGANVRGLNTAATIWCSAAIGVLAGLGAPLFAFLLAVVVLLANTVLRPLAYLLHPPLQISETSYELNLTCRASDEAHVRSLLLATITQAGFGLHSMHSEDLDGSDRTSVRAEVCAAGQNHEKIEEIVSRLSFQPGITALSWSGVPAMVE